MGVKHETFYIKLLLFFSDSLLIIGNPLLNIINYYKERNKLLPFQGLFIFMINNNTIIAFGLIVEY